MARQRIITLLRSQLGGTWIYSRESGNWHSDTRLVRRCSAGVDEWDNPVGPPQYWLYEEGKTPKHLLLLFLR